MSRLLHYYRFILGLFIARVTKLQTRTRDASSIPTWISRPLECSILDTQDNNTVLSNTRRCASHTPTREPTGEHLLLLLPDRWRVQQVREHGGEGVGGQRLRAVHLPQQVEGGEPLRGAGQQVRLLEEHDQHRAHPEVLRLPEVVMEVGGEALEGVGACLLRYDAQQVGQLLRGEGHGILASVTQAKLVWRSASSKLLCVAVQYGRSVITRHSMFGAGKTKRHRKSSHAEQRVSFAMLS